MPLQSIPTTNLFWVTGLIQAIDRSTPIGLGGDQTKSTAVVMWVPW
jgi:hypothetical protein